MMKKIFSGRWIALDGTGEWTSDHISNKKCNDFCC